MIPHKLDWLAQLMMIAKRTRYDDHTFPYWIFETSRNVWGWFGYFDFSSCRRSSARSASNFNLSIPAIGSFAKGQEVRTGDLLPLCSVYFSFKENIAASKRFMASRASWLDFRLSWFSIFSAGPDSDVKILYSSSLRFAFPDCTIQDNQNSYKTKIWIFQVRNPQPTYRI